MYSTGGNEQGSVDRVERELYPGSHGSTGKDREISHTIALFRKFFKYDASKNKIRLSKFRDDFS